MVPEAARSAGALAIQCPAEPRILRELGPACGAPRPPGHCGTLRFFDGAGRLCLAGAALAPDAGQEAAIRRLDLTARAVWAGVLPRPRLPAPVPAYAPAGPGRLPH